MYRIKVKRIFSSAHHLRNYKGKCENVHGHNWAVSVEVEKNELDSSGMVMDFKELKMKLDEILKILDHKDLNEVEYFKIVNPSSENIAKYIYEELKKNLPQDLKICMVEVSETPDSSASYIP